jgi:hypothetical protein
LLQNPVGSQARFAKYIVFCFLSGNFSETEVSEKPYGGNSDISG